MTHVALRTPSCLARSLVSGKLAERCAGDEGWLAGRAGGGAGGRRRCGTHGEWTGRYVRRVYGQEEGRVAGVGGDKAGAWEEEIRFRWAERGGLTSIGAGKERAERQARH